MIRTWCEFIKISHTVFALPFCLIAASEAMRKTTFSWEKTAWIVMAFVAARAFAMAVNRILDKDFDARNPRTAGRHLPAGSITPGTARGFAAACALVFVAAASLLNTLCALLSPAALAYLAFYSYTKRFTRWSHLVLGGALALAPLGADIAILGAVSRPTLALAAAVMFWVAGFDIFYACQDIDFDRQAGLHSLPAGIGQTAALRVAAGFHASAFLLFLMYGQVSHLGRIYFAAQAVILAVLVYEQMLVRRNKIGPAFFQLNGILSLVQLGAVLLDRSARLG